MARYSDPMRITGSDPARPQGVQRRARVLAVTQLLAGRVTAQRGRPWPLRLVLLSTREADLEFPCFDDRKHPTTPRRLIRPVCFPSDQIELSNTFATSLRTRRAPRNALCRTQPSERRSSSPTPAETAARLIIFVTIHYFIYILCDTYPCMKELDKCSQLYMLLTLANTTWILGCHLQHGTRVYYGIYTHTDKSASAQIPL